MMIRPMSSVSWKIMMITALEYGLASCIQFMMQMLSNVHTENITSLCFMFTRKIDNVLISKQFQLKRLYLHITYLILWFGKVG